MHPDLRARVSCTGCQRDAPAWVAKPMEAQPEVLARQLEEAEAVAARVVVLVRVRVRVPAQA